MEPALSEVEWVGHSRPTPLTLLDFTTDEGAHPSPFSKGGIPQTSNRRGQPRHHQPSGACPELAEALSAIEREVEELSPEELAAFRSWFVERDWQAWDQELERDVSAGRLDAFADEALAELERGETTEL